MVRLKMNGGIKSIRYEIVFEVGQMDFPEQIQGNKRAGIAW
jgi:hypothetical protein